MKTTTLTDAQTAELLELRQNLGLGITQLAARYKIGVERVNEIVGTLGLSDQSMNARIAKCVRRNPDWTDAEVAAHCQCRPALVKHRRPQIKLNQKQKDIAEGVAVGELVDRGPPYRVCRKWLRANCSRGERDVRQIQAMCVVVGLRFTLTEVRASCATAGLAVDTYGNVTAPMKLNRS